MKTKTCGRDANCDLVLEHPTVSRVHATIELAGDGRVWVVDKGSRNGTFLQRNGAWIRVARVSLCVGDSIRMGDCEVTLSRLTGVFGKHAGARLGEKRFLLRHGAAGADFDDPGFALSKPRRNPVTGKIEEHQP